MERSTPFMARCFSETRPLTHSRLLTARPENGEETSRNSKLERFPKFKGTAPLNPASDRFKYLKLLMDPKNVGIGILLNVLRLKSKCCNDLSFSNEGLISPLKFQYPYVVEDSAELTGYGLWRSTEMTAPLVLSQLIPLH
jgi:hypothetical protein